MKQARNILLLSAAALLLGGPFVSRVWSQAIPSPAPSASPSASPSVNPSVIPAVSATPPTIVDAFYNSEALNFLHHVDLAEINEANNASGRAQAQANLNLIQAMLIDHQANEQQVLQLAAQLGITIYRYQASTVEVANDSYLATLSGPDFDQVFLIMEKDDHQDVLLRLQQLQNEVSDPDIRNLIVQTIPIIQKHLQLASGGSLQPGPSSSPSAQPSNQPSSQPGTAGAAGY